MAKTRLTWGGNRQAQDQADFAFRQLQKSAKAKQAAKAADKSSRRKRRRPKLEFSNYREYLKTPHWKRKRLKALRFHGEHCCICGQNDQLEVHHKTYKRLGREFMEDLQVLCSGCHSNHHEGEVAGCMDPLTREFVDRFRIG